MNVKKHGCMIFAVVLFFFVCLPQMSAAEGEYSETIDVLKIVYKNEVIASRTYAAFAQKASQENFPEIAALFSALSESERLHAHNFGSVLAALNVTVDDESLSPGTVATTKENLHYAVTVELSEIGEGYPGFIKRVTPEGNQSAIDFLTFAWRAEGQHRDHIEKIQKFSQRFFSAVAKRIKKEGTDYYVCQNCGSTLNEIPDDTCPICSSSSQEYQAIEG